MPRLAITADCHLGYRAFERAAPSGHNQRECDVAQAFRAVVDGMIAAKVEAVLIAGDFFDQPKPSNTALRFATTQLQRLRAGLPSVPIILIAGNHDTNRKMDTGALLPLFAEIGLADVAMYEVRQFVYAALDLRVVAAPHTAVMQGRVPMPEGPERFQVLLAHAEVQGGYGGERPCGQLSAEVMSAGWSGIALGDFHKAHRVTDNAWYPGSTDLTSSNPWEELDTPKQWLLWDLEAGTVEPQLIPPARPFYDLEPIDAIGMEAQEASTRISARLQAQDLADAVVRLKVFNIPRHLSRELDHKMIHAAKARALHLKIEYLVPEKAVRVTQDGTPPQRQSLSDIVAAFLGSYELTPGIDRGAFARLGTELIEQVAVDEAENLSKRGAA